jgi:hypothetical protein
VKDGTALSARPHQLKLGIVASIKVFAFFLIVGWKESISPNMPTGKAGKHKKPE